MLFRFWLITSLIVAFVAYSGAFGIHLLPATVASAQSTEGALGFVVIDDGGR